MKQIRLIGTILAISGMAIFTATLFIGNYSLKQSDFESYIISKDLKSDLFISGMNQNVTGKNFGSTVGFYAAISIELDAANSQHSANEEWDKVIWDSPKETAFKLGRNAAEGPVKSNKGLFFLLTFGLTVVGGFMFILPAVIVDGPPGIKNHHIYHQASTNAGWISWIVFIWLVGFYVLLYFNPQYVVNWTLITDPVKKLLGGAGSSQWFLYGLMYCTVMAVMGVRMIIKYRHNKYQIVRTISVVFFQIVFAFLIVEILPLFGLPGVDLKNAWPLDYDFLFDWNVKDLLTTDSYGKFGMFVLIWGVVLALIIVPVLVYFFGKRWYCSWVCGCGGLAETLGDPYRQLSSKTLFSWKIERWLIHAVLVFAVIMTAVVGYHSYNVMNDAFPEGGQDRLFGISAYDIRSWYGFAIGSVFAGIIGTGFYPVMGNRIWCRFGCPLAAYMGFVQRFKSRFRITTNGGQCISCGNCSTYCEQGIDVRWYAQRGQNIVRSSCVGCGICSAVCPRGVLKLENAPEKGRLNTDPILIGNDGVRLNPNTTES